MIQPARRIITGVDADGIGRVLVEEPLPQESGTPRMRVTNIWSGQTSSVDNEAPAEAGLTPYSPTQMSAGG